MCSEIRERLNCPHCGALLNETGTDEPPDWCPHVQCVFHTMPCWIYARPEFVRAYIKSLISGDGADELFGDEEQIDEQRIMRLVDAGEFGEINLPFVKSVALGVCGVGVQLFTLPERYDATYIITSSGVIEP